MRLPPVVGGSGQQKNPPQRWLAWWVPMAPGLSLIAGNSGLLRSRIHVRIVAWCPDAVNRSDGVRDVDEDVLDAEPRCGQIAERAHAEHLRGVVAGGDQV